MIHKQIGKFTQATFVHLSHSSQQNRMKNMIECTPCIYMLEALWNYQSLFLRLVYTISVCNYVGFLSLSQSIFSHMHEKKLKTFCQCHRMSIIRFLFSEIFMRIQKTDQTCSRQSTCYFCNSKKKLKTFPCRTMALVYKIGPLFQYILYMYGTHRTSTLLASMVISKTHKD